MEKKSGKPPKPLRLLVNLFSKSKGKAKNDNGADTTIARARDRNDNGECKCNSIMNLTGCQCM